MAKKSSAMARLVTSIEVKQPDGSLISVPVSAEDNTKANKIMASKMRSMFESTMKKYQDAEQTLTPKELKEMADAARAIAEFSGEIYKSGDVIQEEDGPSVKQAEPSSEIPGGDFELDQVEDKKT